MSVYEGQHVDDEAWATMNDGPLCLEIRQCDYERLAPSVRAQLAFIQPIPTYLLDAEGEQVLIFRDIPTDRFEEILAMTERKE